MAERLDGTVALVTGPPAASASRPRSSSRISGRHAALPLLLDAAASGPRQVADLINVGSVAGRVARNGSAVYNAT